MRAAIPLYEGDGIIRFEGPVRQAPAPARSWFQSFRGAIAGSIAACFRWLERIDQDARNREMERYLAASTDLCDLERRIREVEYRRHEPFDPFS